MTRTSVLRSSVLASLFAALFAVASLAHAASFDCAKASTPRERTVCSTPALSTLDDQLSAAYLFARTQVSAPAAALIQSDQREWLAHTDALCASHATPATPVTCLTSQYTQRLSQLRRIQHEGNMVFFPRYHAVLVSKPPSSQTPIGVDPGFGYGVFSWPQIDNPNPAEQAWNAAVYRRLIDIAANKKAKSLDESVDATGYITTFYDLHSANASLIDIDLGISTYGWGAAHPNSDVASFPWWLDQQRPLTFTDLFRSDSPRQSALVDLILTKLNVQPSEPYIKPADLRDSVARSIADPASWDISHDAASIRFGQYAIAPYAAGMPEAKLSWTDLRPFLNPTLDPTKLPTPIQPTN